MHRSRMVLLTMVLLQLGLMVPAALVDQPAAPALAASVANVRIDAAQSYQTFDGFGVNANSASWNNGKLAPAVDALVDTMGATVWRVIVES